MWLKVLAGNWCGHPFTEEELSIADNAASLVTMEHKVIQIQSQHILEDMFQFYSDDSFLLRVE